MMCYSVLEHRISVQGQLVFDQSVGGFSGHLAIRDLVTREILGGKLGAVDRGGEVVVVCSLEVDLSNLLGEVVVLLEGEAGNVTEVDHVGWFCRKTAQRW